MVQMPLHANIPPEWLSGIENGKMLIVFPSWSKEKVVSYLVMMNMASRELVCECDGFRFRGECHHVKLLAYCCAGPRHKKKGMQPTSLDAWQSIKDDLGPRQKTVLKALQEIGEASNKQISKLLGWPINTITPRVLELRNMGLVDFSREQVDVKTRRSEIVWRAV